MGSYGFPQNCMLENRIQSHPAHPSPQQFPVNHTGMASLSVSICAIRGLIHNAPINLAHRTWESFGEHA